MFRFTFFVFARGIKFAIIFFYKYKGGIVCLNYMIQLS